MRYISQLSFKPQVLLVLQQMPSLLVHVAMQFHLLRQFLYSQRMSISLNEKCCREAQCREDRSLGVGGCRTSRPAGCLYKMLCYVMHLGHLR